MLDRLFVPNVRRRYAYLPNDRGSVYPAEVRELDGVRWARCRCCDAVGGRLGRRRRLNHERPQWHPMIPAAPSLTRLVTLAATLPTIRQLARNVGHNRDETHSHEYGQSLA